MHGQKPHAFLGKNHKTPLAADSRIGTVAHLTKLLEEFKYEETEKIVPDKKRARMQAYTRMM